MFYSCIEGGIFYSCIEGGIFYSCIEGGIFYQEPIRMLYFLCTLYQRTRNYKALFEVSVLQII